MNSGMAAMSTVIELRPTARTKTTVFQCLSVPSLVLPKAFSLSFSQVGTVITTTFRQLQAAKGRGIANKVLTFCRLAKGRSGER